MRAPSLGRQYGRPDQKVLGEIAKIDSLAELTVHAVLPYKSDKKMLEATMRPEVEAVLYEWLSDSRPRVPEEFQQHFSRVKRELPIG